MAEDGETVKKGLNPLIAIGAAAVVTAVSGGAAFFFAPSGADASETKADDKDHHDDGHEGDQGKSAKKTEKKKKKKGKKGAKNTGDVFVPLEPMIVSLGPEAAASRLKISIVIETNGAYQDELAGLVPKFRDVLNTYLRAADARDFESPAAMSRIRAHIARRLQIVAPEDSIDGVLVTEFILD